MKFNKLLLILNYSLGYIIIYPLVIYIFLQSEYLAITISAVVALCITVYLLLPKLKDDIKDIKITKLLLSGILQTMLIFAIVVVISLILMVIGIEENSLNQKILEEYFKDPEYKLFICLEIVFFAPLVEEGVFRYALSGLIRKSKALYVIVSALLFGSIHLVDGLFSGNYSDFIYLVIYGPIGAVLALNYLRHKENICYPIVAHLIYNGVQLWLMSLML